MHSRELLEGTPCPIPLIESGIKQKLLNECSSFASEPKPNISLIEWIYDNENVRFSFPHSHIRQKKSSKQVILWKQAMLNAAYSNGYNDTNPNIISNIIELRRRIFVVDNLSDHISLNGITKCRDIDIVIHSIDGNDFNTKCFQYKQMDIMEIIRVSNHHRIPGLNGQFAVRSKLKYIPPHTIIGRFCGDEMFGFEYTLLYKKTCEYQMRNHYRMSMKCPNNTWNNIQCPFGDKDNKIVLDELDAFPANPMVIMNDVRQNISNPGLTYDDRKYWNAEFHHMYINGWPLLYVITTKPIYMGQEIATYYGENYIL